MNVSPQPEPCEVIDHPNLAEIELKAPGLYLRFRASKERVTRVAEFMFEEARGAQDELKACK